MKRLKLTNEEKTIRLAVKARTALLQSASRDWESARASVSEAARLEISALNKLRTCGLKMREAAGKEQVNFTFFRMCESSLPKTMSFQAAKFCVHLSRSLEKPIETLDEARSARQMLFEAFGHSQAPKRIEDQSSHEYNPWSDFVNVASSFTSLFTKLETDLMSDWGKDKLSTFLRETEPIVAAHERARLVLQRAQ
jgi:hypothetical protein